MQGICAANRSLKNQYCPCGGGAVWSIQSSCLMSLGRISSGDFASATNDLDIGLVVSNAGTGNPGEFLKLDRQLLEEILRPNTMSHLDIAHYFGGKLAERRRGGLILGGQWVREKMAFPVWRMTGGAKAHVHSLGEALHYEFKPAKCPRHCTGSRGYEHSGARKVRLRSENHANENRLGVEQQACLRASAVCLKDRSRIVPGRLSNRIMNAFVPALFSRGRDGGGHAWKGAREAQVKATNRAATF